MTHPVTHFGAPDSELCFPKISTRGISIPFSLIIRFIGRNLPPRGLCWSYPLGRKASMMAWNQGHKNTPKIHFSDHLMWLRRKCSFTLSNKYQSKLGWNTFFSRRQMKCMLWLRQAPCIIMTHYFSCLLKRMAKYIGYSKSFSERILTTTLLTELFKWRSKKKGGKKKKNPCPIINLSSSKILPADPT